MRTIILVVFLVIAASSQAKSIPASAGQIRRLADVVLVGDVISSDIVSNQHVVEVSIIVREVLFDRESPGLQTKRVSFRFLKVPETEGFFDIGRPYVLPLERCGGGQYVLLGSQFSAKGADGRFDTSLWVGFKKNTSLEEIRRRLLPPIEHDSILTDLRCEQLIEHSENSTENSGPD